jgi:predicted pyridoxine 5'-phosphate oxidase superfamily flavin-nucleotide-binding protein
MDSGFGRRVQPLTRVLPCRYMGKTYDAIDDTLRTFIEAQRMFFVGSAPSTGGHVNVSPKGLDTLRIVDPRTIVYLDYVGSGAETIAHIKENGRIVVMLCAFDGPPKIVRLHGRGEVVEPQHADYAHLRALFPTSMPARGVIKIHIDRISDSCGYGVPSYTFRGQRSQLPAWTERKGTAGLIEYQIKNNRQSIDGLAALDWTQQPHSAVQTVKPEP